MSIKSIALLLSLTSFVSVASLSAGFAQTGAGHQTNKWDVRRNLENGWIVIYSKEFSHEEYLKLIGAIAADVTVSSGSATYAYFSDFAKQSLQQVLYEASRRSPQIYGELLQYLTIDRILSGIKGSFNGQSIGFGLAGMEFNIGRATYNRSECAAIKECVSPRMVQGCDQWVRTPWGSRECVLPTIRQDGCNQWVNTGRRCVPTPNTYQPYIRFRVAR
jgi:hypothetical protein